MPRPALVRRALPGLLAGLGLMACGDPSFGDTVGTSETSGNAPGHEDLEQLLVLTTTDFATGAVASLNLQTGDFAEHALGSSDARVQVIDDQVFVLHRYMFDYLDIFDPAQGWARVAQIPLDVAGVSSVNPQAIARGEDGLLYIAVYGSSELLVVDTQVAPTEAVIDSVDLSALAHADDPDGIVESPYVLAHDDELAVFVQHLDRQSINWPQVAPNLVAFVDPSSRAVQDLDPTLPGVQGLEIPGQGLHQVRRDPKDAGGAYVLSSGLVRVDLDARSVQWAVPPSAFEAQSILETTQPQAFDLDDAGERAFIAAYDPGFNEVTVYSVSFDGPDAGTLVPVIGGLFSVDRSVEIVGDTLWFADTTLGGEGLRAFDLEGNPQGQRIDTGLPPLSLAAR